MAEAPGNIAKSFFQLAKWQIQPETSENKAVREVKMPIGWTWPDTGVFSEWINRETHKTREKSEGRVPRVPSFPFRVLLAGAADDPKCNCRRQKAE
jgi:hypothetical protein